MIWNKETGRCSVKLAAVIIAALTAITPVFADENEIGNNTGSGFDSSSYWEYEGEVDPFDDTPTDYVPSSDETEKQEEVKNEVNLSGTSYYDRELRRFVYPYGTGKVYCSVASGMATKDEVYLEIAEEMNVYVFLNGDALEKTTEYKLTERGDYAISTSGEDIDSRIMSFKIVGEMEGSMYRYDMPESFYISNIYYDDEQLEDISRTYALLAEEGRYTIVYSCPMIGETYTLNMVVDHTAPEITFKGANDKLVARGPVTIEGLNDNEFVYITSNGKEVKPDDKMRLVSSGSYEVLAYDAAGNSTVYNLRILTYINFNGMIFIIVFLVVVGAVVVYLVIHRKKLRVR